MIEATVPSKLIASLIPNGVFEANSQPTSVTSFIFFIPVFCSLLSLSFLLLFQWGESMNIIVTLNFNAKISSVFVLSKWIVKFSSKIHRTCVVPC